MLLVQSSFDVKHLYVQVATFLIHTSLLTSIHRALTAELQVCFTMSTNTGVKLKDSWRDSRTSLSAAKIKKHAYK